jgi:hypothetical protein
MHHISTIAEYLNHYDGCKSVLLELVILKCIVHGLTGSLKSTWTRFRHRLELTFSTRASWLPTSSSASTMRLFPHLVMALCSAGKQLRQVKQQFSLTSVIEVE